MQWSTQRSWTLHAKSLTPVTARHTVRRELTLNAIAMQLEGCVCDVSELCATAAWDVAVQTWPHLAALSSPDVLLPTVRKLWPCLGDIHESVFLMRLTVDEGLVGGRSAKGARQGPVVGHAPRGVRALLPLEILHSWDNSVKEQVMARWSVLPIEEEARCRGDMLLESSIRASFRAALVEAPPQPDRLHPQHCAVASLLSSAEDPVLFSQLPPQLVAQVLDRCGLPASTSVVSIEDSPSELQCALDAHMRDARPELMSTSSEGDLQVIVGSQASLSELQHLRRRQSVGQAAGRAYLAEWASPLSQGYDLIRDVELAEMMGVTSSTLVMDGIEWDYAENP